MHWSLRFLAAPLAILLLLMGAAAAQPSGPAITTITIGELSSPLYAGEEISISVQAMTGDAPAEGDVTVDFGDGSSPATMTLASGVIATSHSYAEAGLYTITAAMAGAQGDEKTVTITGPRAPDLAVEVTPLSAPSTVGDAGSYRVVITNAGNVPITGASLSLSLDKLELDSPYSGTTLNFPLDTLAAGASRRVDFSVTAIGAGEASFAASVDWEGDVDPSNNSDAANPTIAAGEDTEPQGPSTSDIAVTINPLSSPNAVGDTGSYKVSVTNLGNVAFPGGTVEISLQGFSIASAPGCIYHRDSASCDLSQLAPAEDLSFTLGLVLEAETATLSASVAWDGDGNLDNNSSKIDVNIRPVDPPAGPNDITGQLGTRAGILLDHAGSADGRIARLNGVVPTVTPSTLASAFMPVAGGGPLHLSGSLGAIDAAIVPGAAGPNLWFDATVGTVGSTTDGSFGIARIGIDQLITPDLLAGLSLSLDASRLDDGQAELSGAGWLLSPYLTARVAPNLYVDLSAGAGLSDNTVLLSGGKATVGGTRWTASGAIVGDWQSADWSFAPELRFSYLEESTEAYSGPAGDLAAATAGIARLSAGPTAAYHFTLGDAVPATARIKLDAHADQATGADPGFDLDLTTGLRLTLPNRMNLDLSLTATGILESSPSTLAVSAGLSGALP